MIYFKHYCSTAQIPSDWNAMAMHDLFLHTSYLKALQEAAPKTISLYYIGIFKDDILVGISVVQRVQLYAKNMFRSESRSTFSSIAKDVISRVLKGNILVIGNLTHTGQHGLYFNPEHISQSDFLKTVIEAIADLKTQIKKKNNKTIRAVLFKDYFKDDPLHQSEGLWQKNQFYHVNVQPNMVLKLRPEWQNNADYLNDLHKKYKTRYKRAKKKLGKISLKELSENDILCHSEHLDHLYRNVSNNASFNTFVLPPQHFYNFKRGLGDNFRVFTYAVNGEIIGFFTLILNNDILETYFLGYDEAHQYDNQLYLNMLYDMIAFGIENQFKSIVFARTAMAIKSSVGAEPRSMSIYIKHTNPVINALLKPIFKVMNPNQQWKERHPFKGSNIS